MQADWQTRRQTDTHIAILDTPVCGEVNIINTKCLEWSLHSFEISHLLLTLCSFAKRPTFKCHFEGGVPSKFEKSDECPPWILLTEKERFGDNIWMYDASVPWNHVAYSDETWHLELVVYCQRLPNLISSQRRGWSGPGRTSCLSQ